MKLTTFYNLMVKEAAESEGVQDKEENRKDVLELSQQFLARNNFYASYVGRTIMELILSIGLLIIIGVLGIPSVLQVTNARISEFIILILKEYIENYDANEILNTQEIIFQGSKTNRHCDVYGIAHECAGEPTGFYLFLSIIATVFLVAYVFCSVYTLFWLWCPCGKLNLLSHIMYR